MAANIYVGNLSYTTTSGGLENLFAEYGEVAEAHVITDRETGRSRGFGFVEMKSTEAAEKAIASLNGKDVDGRQLQVNVAKPRSG